MLLGLLGRGELLFEIRNDAVLELAGAVEAPFALLLPTWLLILANIYFGIDTDLTVGVAQRAAEVLMGGGP